MDRIYRINGKINRQLLIDEVEKCKYERVKDMLVKILVNANFIDHR